MDEQKQNEYREEDLERYGVWVKAGPEEVVDADDDFSFTDLPADSTSDLPDIDAGSDRGSPSDQDDDFDIPDIEDLDLDDIGDDDATGDSADSDADEDLVSLDDLDLEEPDGETDPFSVLDDGESSFDGADLSEPEELSIPDNFDEPEELSLSEDEPEELSLSEDEDELSLPDDLSELEELSETETDNTGDEDFDLDELSDSLDDDFEELEIETPEVVAEPSDDADDIFESTIPGSDDELEDIDIEEFGSDDSDSGDSEELPELTVENEHDFTPEDQGIEIAPQTPTNQITPDEEDFLTVEEDLQNGDESAIPKEMDTKEREAFSRIQTELTDIKRELAELKQALRGAGAGAAAQPAPPAPDEAVESPLATEEPLDEDTLDMGGDFDEDDEARPSGFFEEDEDETIALTGDELDNILNTAEFTEQAGEAEELEDDYIVENADEPVESAEPVESTEPEEPSDETVSEIEMEPVEDAEDQLEDDHPAINELADMDIDQELSDIESLHDESSDDGGTDPDEIEIDLDALDEIAEPEEEPEQETPTDDNEDGFDAFASAVEQDIAGTELDESEDVAEIDEIELNDDFEDETEPEEYDEPVDETPGDDEEEIELDLDDLDDLEVEDIDLDDETAEATGEQRSTEEAPSTLESEQFEETVSPPEEEHETLDEPEEFAEEVVEEAVEKTGPTEHSVTQSSNSIAELPEDLKQEIRSVLSYMDQLLEALPDDKIEEFAQSEHFDVYKRLFEELGLET